MSRLILSKLGSPHIVCRDMFDVLPKDPLKSAKTEKEIKELLEAGFEYVFTHEGIAYFRKRK